MNLKYMLIKDRFRFLYSQKPTLYSYEYKLMREKEISLFLKELSLFRISMKLLSKLHPSQKIKDELLNIAFACAEEPLFMADIRGNRTLPLKELSNFTYKSKAYLEKWQHLLIAYILLISNNSYKHISSFLNIENLSSRTNKNTSLSLTEVGNFTDKKTSGLVIKKLNKALYIMTAFGEFKKITPNVESDKDIGGICVGHIKKDLSFYKYPLLAGLISTFCLLIFAGFIYVQPKTTVLITANSSIKLQVNRSDKTVKVTALSQNGKKIVDSINLNNQSLDDSIYYIFKEGRHKGIIKSDTQITIFISSSQKEPTVLTKTEGYITEYNLNVQINSNGIEHKITQK